MADEYESIRRECEEKDAVEVEAEAEALGALAVMGEGGVVRMDGEGKGEGEGDGDGERGEEEVVQRSVGIGAQPAKSAVEGWMMVFAGHLVFMNTWGITSTFGAFQTYYTTTLLPTTSPSAISWIGSIQSFLVVFVGIITGPLYDRGHLRPLLLAGALLTVAGMFTTSLAHTYPQVLLAQGIAVGLGAGLTYVPALAIVAVQFPPPRRALAIGCASSGSSIGGIVFPILFRRLLPHAGFGWSVRAIAFINLTLFTLALLILCRRPGPAAATARRLLDVTAFREAPFALLALANLFVFTAYYIPLFYLGSYATRVLRASDAFAFYLLAISNGRNFLGRVLPYLLPPRLARPIVTYAAGAGVGVVLLFAWIGIRGAPALAGFVAWSVAWGFVAGVLVTAVPAAVAHPALCPSPGVLGARLGMSWSTAAVGTLVGAPIAGALVDVQDGVFWRAQVFAGVVMVVGAGALVGPVRGVLRWEQGVEREREEGG